MTIQSYISCKAVCGNVEAHLHQDNSLAELAALTRLRTHQFCRASRKPSVSRRVA